MKLPKLVFLLLPLCLLLPLAALAQRSNKVQDKPNVILILADDLGWGDLGSYGQTKIKTPHLDQMAAEGMRFTQFYPGSPGCAPSRSVLMTGKHGGHAYIRDNREVKPEGQWPIPASEVTIAELLKSQGYATGAYSCPFPRAKGQVYDFSNRVPLAVMWRMRSKLPGAWLTITSASLTLRRC